MSCNGQLEIQIVHRFYLPTPEETFVNEMAIVSCRSWITPGNSPELPDPNLKSINHLILRKYMAGKSHVVGQGWNQKKNPTVHLLQQPEHIEISQTLYLQS